VDGHHDDFENPAELSEAEQMAALASPPQRRVDGLYAASGMKVIRPLTAHQQAYARGLIEGKTMRQAYRDAYPGDSSNNAAISASAWKLKQNPAVQALVSAAWEDTIECLSEDVAATKRFVLKELLQCVKTSKQEGSKLKALELMGKTVGLFIAAPEQAIEPVTAQQLKKELAGHLLLIGGSSKAKG
jgi:hypothetical protein